MSDFFVLALSQPRADDAAAGAAGVLGCAGCGAFFIFIARCADRAAGFAPGVGARRTPKPAAWMPPCSG